MKAGEAGGGFLMAAYFGGDWGANSINFWYCGWGYPKGGFLLFMQFNIYLLPKLIFWTKRNSDGMAL